MIIDLVASALFLILVAKGFSAGLIPTLLGLVGYVSGGFAGLLIAKEVTEDWEGLWSAIGLHLLAIMLGVKLGQVIARSLGRGIRGVFGPFKFLDSLFGGFLGGVKAVVLISVSLYFLDSFPNQSIARELQESQVDQYLKERAPDLLDESFARLKEISKD
jgi:uncharacterized membrane protein required for colicin V production